MTITLLSIFATAVISYAVKIVAQDCYHRFSHPSSEVKNQKDKEGWLAQLRKLVQKLHAIGHHTPFKKLFELRIEIVDFIRKGYPRHELIEGSVISLATAAFVLLLWAIHFPYWYAALYGFLVGTHKHLYRSLIIYFTQDIEYFKTIYQGHLEGVFQVEKAEAPSRWVVNALYHERHHSEDAECYICAEFPFLDWLWQTAFSFKSKRFLIVSPQQSVDTALELGDAIPSRYQVQVYLV